MENHLICINSDEKLIFQNLLEAYNRIGERPLFFYSGSDNSSWFEVESWLERIKNRETVNFLTYYYVVTADTDVYDMYAHLKMVCLLSKGFISQQIVFQIVFTYSDDRIEETDAINTKAMQLYEKMFQQTEKQSASFQIKMVFHFVYNLFGGSNFIPINEGNQIQQFINVNNASDKVTYLTVDPRKQISGTDVALFCGNLIKAGRENTINRSPDLYRDTIRMPKPVYVQELVDKINNGTINIKHDVEQPSYLNKKESALYRLIDWQSIDSLTDQIMAYIK